MAAPSPSNRFCEHRLEIRDIKKLADIVNDLESDPSQAFQITAISVIDDEFKASDSKGGNLLESEGIGESGPDFFNQISMQMTRIVNELERSGSLESFRWVRGTNKEKPTRATDFWEALWKTAATLKNPRV